MSGQQFILKSIKSKSKVAGDITRLVNPWFPLEEVDQSPSATPKAISTNPFHFQKERAAEGTLNWSPS
jgi:hypothetical protein